MTQSFFHVLKFLFPSNAKKIIPPLKWPKKLVGILELWTTNTKPQNDEYNSTDLEELACNC